MKTLFNQARPLINTWAKVTPGVDSLTPSTILIVVDSNDYSGQTVHTTPFNGTHSTEIEDFFRHAVIPFMFAPQSHATIYVMLYDADNVSYTSKLGHVTKNQDSTYDTRFDFNITNITY